jgi:hypothetical protein
MAKNRKIIIILLALVCFTGGLYEGYRYYKAHSLSAIGYNVVGKDNLFKDTKGFENYSEANVENIHVDPKLMRGKLIVQDYSVKDKSSLHNPAFYKAILMNTVIPSGEIKTVNFTMKQPYPNVFYLFAENKNDLTAKDYAIIFVPHNSTMQTYIFAIAQVYMPTAIQTRLKPFIEKYAVKN